MAAASYDHGSLLKELYDLVVAAPEFSYITGTSLAQNTPDPTLISLTPPACWVSFLGDQQKEQEENVVPQTEVIVFMFVAFIYLPMTKQNEMLTGAKTLPLLKTIIDAVRGKESAINTGHRWAYRGQKLALVNVDRMVYAQRYTITGVL